MAKCIAYNQGYKYQLKETYVVTIPLRPEQPIKTDYIELDTDGNLTIVKGYAWDGPSGPTVDTLSFMRGALVHDALYQLMRGEQIDHIKYREIADKILKDICIEDGMWRIRAAWVYAAVRVFGKWAADPRDKRPVVFAPKSGVR